MTGARADDLDGEPGRFVLTLGWPGETGGEQASVGLDVLDAARLRDALSLWLAGVEERRCAARSRPGTQPAHAAHDDERRAGRRRRMNYDDATAPESASTCGGSYPRRRASSGRAGPVVRQVTFTEAHESTRRWSTPPGRPATTR